VEKAHKSVLNVLLQILDDGRLTDGKGRTVDFRNTVIILTSNTGADVIMREVQQNQKITGKGHKLLQERLRRQFLPEFLNRLDEVVVFAPLSPASLRDILAHQVSLATSRLSSAEFNITVDLAPSAADFLLEEGYDVVNGARPLRRLIERVVVTELSRLIVGGQLPPNSRVAVELADGGRFRYVVEGEEGGKTEFFQDLEELLPNSRVAAGEEEEEGGYTDEWGRAGGGGEL
jgi:ATP-dependent Clp protease ATP-binding subunit ClpB